MHFFRALPYIVFMFVLLNACTPAESDEAQLRAAINAMGQALENRDSGDFMRHISDEYGDKDAHNRQQLRRLLAGYFLRYPRIGVYLSPGDIELKGAYATMIFTAGVTGGEDWLPERGKLYKLTTGWRKENGEWRLLTAKWVAVAG